MIGKEKPMSHLFTPLKIKDIEFRNRIFVSPMCQYSSVEGMPTDWHLVHLVSRAVGGAGLVMVEATAVSREGRISPDDSGIWTDEHVRGFQRITRLIKEQGAVPGIQLAHAGRKASTRKLWLGGGPLAKNEHPWQTLAPSAVPFAEGYPAPKALEENDLDELLQQYETATKRAVEAGFETTEIHMAHGYLLHQFLSPLSNKRTDKYGGSFENRTRFPLEVARVVRETWPDKLPLFVRISVTDWADGGWDLEQSIQLAKSLKEIGIDLMDCSSGGLITGVKIPVAPGYQTGFAAEIRRQVNIKTAAVGLITEPHQAEHILTTGQADAVFLAREMLRDPYWPLKAARELGDDVEWPPQYQRAKRK
jgi:2,4-dienoyl-CoA reductase-like NADH-dependent reductase (Old Yellow Enzyme family)